MERATPGYTCIACRVVFVDPELQRAHYKTDWHRYNLKRKVAELPPVTADNFQQRVLVQRAADKESETRRTEFCQTCRKHFANLKSYDSHTRSRKHRDKAAAERQRKSSEGEGEDDGEEEAPEKEMRVAEKTGMEVEEGGQALDANRLTEEEDVSMESDDEPDPLDISECLFCSHSSDDLESNLGHMSLAHGFFIPDLDYLVDVKGLVAYLGEKVGIGYTCLYCNERGKTFFSVQSAQQHMVDKCHCKIFFDADAALEYAEFYDYSKSYPDGNNPMEGSGKALAIPDSSLEVTEDLELVLPSGARVGHRSLKYIYKQHVPSDDKRRSALVGRLLAQYRAIGWRGAAGGGGARSERDVAWAKRMQAARDMRLGVKANRLQKHFRPQVIF